MLEWRGSRNDAGKEKEKQCFLSSSFCGEEFVFVFVFLFLFCLFCFVFFWFLFCFEK